MPENTIVSSSNSILRQLESSDQRSREAVSSASSSEVPEKGITTVSNPVSVEVDISQESVELSLATSQQVRNAEQATESQNQDVAASPAPENAQTPQTVTANEAEIDQGQLQTTVEQAQTDTNVAISRQFNPSANESLGTVIDVIS
jgi:hypothetical protein